VLQAHRVLFPFLFLGLAGSCASSGTSGSRLCRGIEPNGPELTGTALSRQLAPGCPVLEGIQLRSVDLEQGVLLPNGQELRDVSAEGGGLRAGDRPLKELVGATLSGTAETGHAVTLRIDKIVPNDASGAPLFQISYRFRDQPAEDPRWLPLCKGAEPALALAGQWDLTVGPGGGGKVSAKKSLLTLACQSSALGKCVTVFSYKPWAKTPLGTSLDELHQSCVRAVRADYCGNGQSNTQKDERINFYDSAGVQHDAADWPLEAVWSADGARCVETTRLRRAPHDPRTQRPETDVREYIQRTCPQILHPCTDKLPATPSAGDALLFTEVAPSTPGGAR